MEKRIELERRGRSPSKIEDLNLDNCKSASVIGLSEEWSGLKNLSLINVGLTSLKSFPRLPSLEKLELSDNWISGGLEALTCLPKLMYLNLSGNKITSIDTLKPLKSISTLVNLDLFNCDVVNEEDYRKKVFDLIPSLVYLDGFDKEGNELDDEDDDEEAAGNNRADGEDDDEDLDDEEDEDDDDEDDEDEDDEGEDEEDVPLDAIYKNYDPRGDGDYEATEDGEGDEEEEDLDDEEEDQAAEANTNNCVDADNEGGGGRGKKRKHEGEEDQ